MLDKQNGVATGNNLRVWLNGELLEDLKSFEYKITLDFADVTFIGDYATYGVYQGFSGSGTLNFNKTQSRGASLLKDAINTGVMPDLKIVTKLLNKSTGKAERAVISMIQITEFGGTSEAKTVIEESLPIRFSKVEFPELM